MTMTEPARRSSRAPTGLRPGRGRFARAATVTNIGGFVGIRADPNDRSYLEVEAPAGNGVGTARGIARVYSALAEGGRELGITPDTLHRITAPPDVENPVDEVLGVPSCFSLGFLRPGPGFSFGSGPRSFGSPGAGGSFAFADPDVRIGYAYVMNRMNF